MKQDMGVGHLLYSAPISFLWVLGTLIKIRYSSDEEYRIFFMICLY